MKKKMLIAAKLIFTALVFWWVLHKLGPEGLGNLRRHIQNARPGWLLFALGLFLVPLALGIWRWRWLLRVQGIHLSWHHTAWMVAAGSFFNAFLVGATGGDLLKAWYAAQAAPDRKAEAVLSIAVDRLIGILGLFVLATISVLVHLSALLSDTDTRPVAFLVIASLAGALVVVALTTQRHRITAQPWWKKFWRRLPGKQLLSKLSESYNLYGRYPGVLAGTLALSVGVHVAAVLVAWAVGNAIGIQEVQLIHYFVYCPIINAIAAIPITVSGLGVREAAFLSFFTNMEGVPKEQAVALSLLFYATTLVISLACGVLYLVGKPRAASRPKVSD
ncbi:MAG: flippase-like domain-containing protein [Verrucomicrobia bacterium]|nr:flippase-like domain-containing protein [Verrucomicrobiota bacterium]